MTSKNTLGWVVRTALLLAAACVVGCHHSAGADFRGALPEGMVALRKIGPAEYPDFGRQPVDANRLRAAIDNSLLYMAAPFEQGFYPYLDISHERAVASLKKLRGICDELEAKGAWDPVWFNQQIVENFDVYKSYGAAGG